MATLEAQSSDTPNGTRPDRHLGEAFAHALARRDFAELGELLHAEIDLRALTPGRTWEPASHGEALEVLRTWFGDYDVEQVVSVETDTLADRQRVGYRFRGQRTGDQVVIEQQAYYNERDGRIDWMRIVCTGYRAA